VPRWSQNAQAQLSQNKSRLLFFSFLVRAYGVRAIFFVGGFLGIPFALLSALLFGGGDFSGGFATRHRGAFQVLAWSALSGAASLGLLAWLLREPLPSPGSALWAAGAGLSGALGLTALYRALSRGNAALVSPLAGIVGAALPVIVGAFTEGLPGTVQLLGFASAGIGIGLVTRTPSASGSARGQVALGILAGCGFGFFFLLLAQVAPGAVLVPLMTAKVAAVCVAWGIAVLGQHRMPAVKGSGIAWLSGALDAGANALYLLAQQHTRLDVAVVLTSLYPAFTVLLAYVVLKERVSRVQWAGVGLCSAAIALIAV
jgi:drug/metabolite transporter (DMT)-like permease